MKTILALAVLAAAIASPAFAQTWQPYGGNTVTSGNRVLGTDPDPNVRFDLQREQNWRNGGY
jgi:opacity protein-like surface antigen